MVIFRTMFTKIYFKYLLPKKWKPYFRWLYFLCYSINENVFPCMIHKFLNKLCINVTISFPPSHPRLHNRYKVQTHPPSFQIWCHQYNVKMKHGYGLLSWIISISPLATYEQRTKPRVKIKHSMRVNWITT